MTDLSDFYVTEDWRETVELTHGGESHLDGHTVAEWPITYGPVSLADLVEAAEGHVCQACRVADSAAASLAPDA